MGRRLQVRQGHDALLLVPVAPRDHRLGLMGVAAIGGQMRDAGRGIHEVARTHDSVLGEPVTHQTSASPSTK